MNLPSQAGRHQKLPMPDFAFAVIGVKVSASLRDGEISPTANGNPVTGGGHQEMFADLRIQTRDATSRVPID
jgi:hypothetical protein